MKKHELIIGIDVSKLELDVCLMQNPSALQHHYFVVPNNEKGIKQILEKIKKQKYTLSECLFCFENTGVYSMPLSYVLGKLRMDYWSVPAIEIKRSKGISRGKSDKIDAKEIAFYAHTHIHKLKLSQLPEKDIMKLKMLFTERDKLIRTIGILDTTKENKGYMPNEVIKEVLLMNAKTVKLLTKQLQAVEAKMQEIIVQNAQINAQYKLICSVPGVGTQTAIYLIITTKCFYAFDSWRKLACYAGVAPFEYSSGSSIKGRTKVNHLADKKMKSLLNMCALNIKKVDKDVANYYQRKVAEGKNKMLVMNAIRCKVLSRVFATVNRGTPYVNLQKFAA